MASPIGALHSYNMCLRINGNKANQEKFNPISEPRQLLCHGIEGGGYCFSQAECAGGGEGYVARDLFGGITNL